MCAPEERRRSCVEGPFRPCRSSARNTRGGSLGDVGEGEEGGGPSKPGCCQGVTVTILWQQKYKYLERKTADEMLNMASSPRTNPRMLYLTVGWLGRSSSRLQTEH